MSDRREFFRSLIAGGATVRNNRKPVKHENEMVHHGPMVIPSHVAESIREEPVPHRTSARHLALRYAEADGTVYLFRSRIPETRAMVGEIVWDPKTQRYRVHCWTAARPRPEGGEYRTAPDIIERDRLRRFPEPEPHPDSHASILPPLGSLEIPEWNLPPSAGIDPSA